MLLLSFSRHVWQFERPEKQGGRVYITRIFSVDKGTKMFLQLQDSTCHQTSSAYHLIVHHGNDVGEMTHDQVTQRKQLSVNIC